MMATSSHLIASHVRSVQHHGSFRGMCLPSQTEMATLQGLQTTLFSHIRQPQFSHSLHNCSNSSQHHSCRGHSFRDDRVQARLSGSRTNRTSKLEVRKYYCTHRADCVRYSQLELEWLISVRTYRGKMHTAYIEQRCRKVVGPVCCLRTSPVEQAELREAEEEKNLSTSSSQEKSNADVTETQGWAVRRGLSALDAYFDKLHASNRDESTSSSVATSRTVNRVSTTLPATDTSKSGSDTGSRISQGNVGSEVKDQQEKHGIGDAGGLSALDAYFNKLRPTKAKDDAVANVPEETGKVVNETKLDAEKEEEKKLKVEIIAASDSPIEADEAEYRELLEELEKALEQGAESGEASTDGGSFLPVPSWGFEAGKPNSFVVNGLVAINIAVYLFGLASPQGVPGMADASLPYLYGAKVNELIVNGEWWRLVTPMFLHSGLLHVGLSTWTLLSFGPAVESAYGAAGFGMIYLLGGLFGNLMSFFHTPQGTVGGTGPIWALMATWLVYLLRNREIIGPDVADDMIRKVFIMSAINVALCNSFPIDDWTHVGAGAVGLIFGLLTCPQVQLNVHVEEVAGENSTDDTMESYVLLNDLEPYRVLLVFALSLAVFFALYNIGVPVATEFHFLHGGLGDENW